MSLTQEDRRCSKSKDGRQCSLVAHHPSYHAANVGRRWFEWHDAAARVSTGVAASLDQARTFADLADHRGKHRRRGTATQALDYRPTHDGTQEPRIDLVATVYDYRALLDGHTARAIERILRAAS